MSPSALSHTLLPALSLLVLAPLVTAQRANSGALQQAAFTYFVADGTVDLDGIPFSTDSVRTRKPGNGQGFEGLPVVTGRPNFTWDAMFPNAVGKEGPLVEIDAFSIGLDLLWVDPEDPTGTIALPTGDWHTVVFSVAADSDGSGPTVGAELAAGSGGADVFDYMSELSNVPPRFQERTSRTVDSDELEMMAGNNANEISALDFHVPLYDLDDAFVSQLPRFPSIYFSLTSATAASAPSSWFTTVFGTPITPSGAVILSSSWSPIFGWSEPRVYMTPFALGLTSADDVDALAVDRSYEQSAEPVTLIVYSTTGGPTETPSELLFSRRFVPTGTAAVPDASLGKILLVSYKDNDGLPVESKSRSGDRIDSVCVVDPSIIQSPIVFSWSSPLTTPLASSPLAEESLWASSFRSCVPGASVPTPRLDFFLSGFGSAGPRDETAICLVSLTSPDVFPTYIPISVQNRSRFSRNGAPLTATLQDPSLATLRFQPLYSLWLTFAPGDPQVHLSNATIIQF